MLPITLYKQIFIAIFELNEFSVKLMKIETK